MDRSTHLYENSCNEKPAPRSCRDVRTTAGFDRGRRIHRDLHHARRLHRSDDCVDGRRFNNITTPTSNNIGSVGCGGTFSRAGLTITDGGIANSDLTVLDNTYLNGGNQIRTRFGVAAGTVPMRRSATSRRRSAARSTHSASTARRSPCGFVGNASTTFSYLIDGVAAGSFSYSGSSDFGFLGFTPTTSFSSVTIVNGSHVSDDLFDNVSSQAAPRVAAVPEADTLALLGLGLVGIAFARRRKRA